MKFSYNWIREFVPTDLAPAEAAQLFTMHTFEVKEIEKRGDDALLDIDVLSNRAADLLSHVGVARELAILTGKKFAPPTSTAQETADFPIDTYPKPSVKDSSLCSRYSLRAMRGVRVHESPDWLKERLATFGIRAINNIVDAANYVMLELGQPLRAFDAEKVSGAIEVRLAKPGEQLITLDERALTLNVGSLVIADASGAIGLAGIKGGASTGVTKATTAILIEAGNFQPGNIRRTSLGFGLVTDAAVRFQRGLAPSMTVPALDRVASLIQELAGGEIARGVHDIYPYPAKPHDVELRLERVSALLGTSLKAAQVSAFIKLLGFGVKVFKPGVWRVSIPVHRPDIAIEEDLIEEVGRLYGYENIPATLPVVAVAPPEGPGFRQWVERVKHTMAGFGFTEVYNYAYVSAAELEWLGMREIAVELENPVNTEKPFLKPSLLPHLLQNVRDNLRFFSEVNVFEFGKTFEWRPDPTSVEERWRLAGIVAHRNANAQSPHAAVLEAKGVVEGLLEALGITDAWFDDAPAAALGFFAVGRWVEIKVGETIIGRVGEVAAEVARRYDVTEPVAIFGLDGELLAEFTAEEHEYEALPKYPALIRDISLFVSEAVRIAQIENVISSAGGELVEDVDLFDMYEPEGSEERRSIAFHIVYRAKDRTLSERDVDAVHRKISKALTDELGAEVR